MERTPKSPEKASLERLTTLTRALERDVPSVRGSFPDFEKLGSELKSESGRTAVYALGTIKSGKSTLLSALIEADALPRGSGVKTFNISRVHASDAPHAIVHFRSPAQLTKILSFDFRMLGVIGEVPDDPLDLTSLPKLRDFYESFKRGAAEDGRLEALVDAAGASGFLALASARVEHTLSCLERLKRDNDARVLLEIKSKGRLEFRADAFDNYRTWAGAPELSAIIHEIEVGLPFPARLPSNLSLVDCQGSDSLNPLDFAAVDAALHRAERIFYVVSSRLGLRGADRDLLAHIRQANLAAKMTVIYNVEAFEPLSEAELTALTSKLRRDLDALNLKDVASHTVCALLQLVAAVRPDEANAIRGLWSARGASAVLSRVENSYSEVLTHLAQVAGESFAEGPGRVVPLLLTRAEATAKALLARDRDVYGLQSSELDEKEVRVAVKRILDGERAELHKRLTKKSFETFDGSGELQQAIDAFLKAGAQRFVAGHPIPDAVRLSPKHGPVIGAALEIFNTEWAIFDSKLRLQHISPFVEQAFKMILDSLAHMHRLIPGVLGPKLSEVSSYALPSAAVMTQALKEKLDRAVTAMAVPEVLRPVLLLPAIASGLAAEFYARGIFSVVKSKVTRKPLAPEANLDKVNRLWERSLAQAFKAAVQDTEFSVSSARENFRFQYFGKIAEALFLRFEELVIGSVDRYFVDVARLQSASKLLLSGDDRARVEEYLKAL